MSDYFFKQVSLLNIQWLLLKNTEALKSSNQNCYICKYSFLCKKCLVILILENKSRFPHCMYNTRFFWTRGKFIVTQHSLWNVNSNNCGKIKIIEKWHVIMWKSHLKMARFLTVHLCLEEFHLRFFLRWIKKLIRLGKEVVIQKSIEPTDWTSPVVPVVKKKTDIKLCVDLKKINSVIKKEHYIMRTLEDVSPKLSEFTVFFFEIGCS